MENFWEFAKLTVLVIGSIIALFLILISLPSSRLSSFFLYLYSYGMYLFTGLCVLYIISPVDLIPDVIPLAGQMDDAVALIVAVFSGVFGWMSQFKAKKFYKLENNKQKFLKSQ